MLLSQKLEQMSIHSQDARKTISEFLLKERKRIHTYSMQKIADETFSSKAALSRVAKKLGYSGWNEFMAAFVEEVRYLETHKTNVNVNMPFEGGSSPLEIAGNIAAVKEAAIRDTIELLHRDTVDQIVDALIGARRICLFGTTVNRYLEEIFQHKMLLIGRAVELVNHVEERYQVETLGKEDCAIVISYSGNDVIRNPMHLLPGLKDHGVTIVGITSMGDNLLRDYSNHVLTIASQEKLYSKIGAFATESSTLFLLDTIFGCYFARNFEDNLDYKVSMARAVDKRRYSTSEGIREDGQIN